MGLALIMFLGFVIGLIRRAQTQAEVEEILEDAKEKAKDIEDAAKARSDAYVEKQIDVADRENKKIEDRLEQLETKVKKREDEYEERYEEFQKKVSEHQSKVDIYDNHVSALDNRLNQRRQKYQSLLIEFIKKLEVKTETPKEIVLAELKEKALNEKQLETSRALQTEDEGWQNQAEIEAKKLLTLVINRFARPYCPERGIGYLNFDSDEQKKRVLGEEQAHLRLVEKICGVDLAYDEQNNAVNVYGFDPVRRELGRATIDRLMRERTAFSPSRIEQLAEQTKKDLFQRIHNDGTRIAKELRLNNLSPEIKNMMGALRYRYSFTQNQYFHCSEVGHLCGLLASELDVSTQDARRAGLLHDIGKSMDHSIDGGHAVIGADFIKQHGEQDHIVHAVRAHHFDEQPSTNLAYLVIAADAISGARPGARRSTVATYTQKIQDLQTIARGFNGVIDTHVLSAGREVRVYVDGKALDDLHALDLSKQIANKIEAEMQYPGHIRVTVVRETQAVEYAK